MFKDRDKAPDPMQPALIVTYGNTSRKRRPLDKPVLVLGRSQGCDMPLMSPDVAPVHCVIVKLANGWRIRDCSGHLGTRINGKNITEEALTDEDHLQIGPFNFKVHLPASPETPQPRLVPESSPPERQDSGEKDRSTQSRQNLIRLARAYRDQAQAALKEQQDLKQFLDRDLKEITADKQDLDRDWQQLEKSARALRVRELDLEKAEQVLRERFKRVEEELAELRRQGTANAEQARAQSEAAFQAQHEAMLAEVQRQKDALENQREHLENQCEDLDSERLELEKIRSELDQARLEVDGLRSQAEAEHARARVFLKQSEESALQIAERERHLTLRANELDAYAAKLRADAQSLASQRLQAPNPSEDHSETQALREQLEVLERQNESLREQLDNQLSQSQIQVLRVEDETLRKSLDEARTQLEQFRMIADALQRENEELRKKIPTSENRENVLGAIAPSMVARADLEASEAAYAALQMQFKRLQVERDQERSRTREAVENLRQENELLRGNGGSGILQVGAAEIAAANLQGQLKRLHAEREEESARYRAQIAELRQEMEILRQGMQADSTAPRPMLDDHLLGQKEIASLNKEIDRLRAKIKDLYEDNEILKQQQLAPATTPLDEFERASSERASEATRAEIETLRAQVDQLIHENNRLRETAESRSEQPQSETQVESELRHQVEILKDRLVELQLEQEVERKALEHRLESAQRETRDHSLKQSQYSDAEIQEILVHLDHMQRENEELEGQLRAHHNLEVELSTRTRTISLLEQQLQTLQGEMERLRSVSEQNEEQLTQLRAQAASAGSLKTLQGLREQIAKLQGDLKDRDALIEKLSVELDTPAHVSLENSGGYERELHQFRLELERDRRQLDEQLTEIRLREKEIEDAARDTELLLARERAALARERNELNRMRDEIRMDQERLERQVSRRPVAAGVGVFREIFNQGNQQENPPGGGNSNGKRR